MAISLTPETGKTESGNPGSPDIYRPAGGIQLARLCGALATWSRGKYLTTPDTYRPEHVKRYTRLVIAEGDELVGLEMRAASSPFLIRSIHRAVSEGIPKFDNDPTTPAVAKVAEGEIDERGCGKLWLAFDQSLNDPDQLKRTTRRSSADEDDDLSMYADRQSVESILEDATKAQVRLKEDFRPGITLMEFAPDTISQFHLKALAHKITKEALPIPVDLGEVIFPAWMRQPAT